MNRLFSLAVPLITPLLAGCNFAPQYVRPPLKIPSVYSSSGHGVARATDADWQSYFGDPRLRAYIAAALTNNRELAQSVARIAQARAQFGIGESQRLPTLEFAASAARDGTVTEGDRNTLGIQIAGFELDLWGRARNAAEAGRHRYLATVEADHAFRLSLIGQVAATYFKVLEGHERIALADRALAVRVEGQRIAKRRMEAGVTSSADFDQATLLVTQAETELVELRRATALAENYLDVLIGGAINQPMPAGRPLADPAQVVELDPGLPVELVAQRPDILRAEQELRAANADIGAARAAFLPSISLGTAVGFGSSGTDRLLGGEAAGFRVSGGGLLTIFDAARRRSQLGSSRARAEELVAAYQHAVQNAFREVADAMVAHRSYTEQITILTNAVAVQRSLSRTAHRRYEFGVVTYLEVLDADRSLFETEQALLSLRSSALQNAVSLYVALGGGEGEP